MPLSSGEASRWRKHDDLPDRDVDLGVEHRITDREFVVVRQTALGMAVVVFSNISYFKGLVDCG